jgi:excisionase family DNA binding protein
MTVTDLPVLYTEKDIAKHLDVNPETLARWRRAGKITHTMIGGRVRYTAAHLAAYLEQQECGSTSSREKTASGTSGGQTPMGPRAAHQLAREIAGRPSKP